MTVNKRKIFSNSLKNENFFISLQVDNTIMGNEVKKTNIKEKINKIEY